MIGPAKVALLLLKKTETDVITINNIWGGGVTRYTLIATASTDSYSQ